MSATAQQLQTTELPAAGTWAIDPVHSSVEFVAKHLMVSKVRGRFGRFTGSIVVGADPADSSATITIDSSSIDTNMPARDDHLRSPDFLDSEGHPEIVVRSTGGSSLGDGRWKVDADLTIRGTTLPIELEAEYLGTTEGPRGDVAHFEGKAEFDREAFGMTWNQALESGGWLVGKKVRIEVQVEALRSDA
ncbi:MAG TPA: YceI family protein [Actinomycetota bacterium]|nr:YceI family protein [Actinomycetota bacterium]